MSSGRFTFWLRRNVSRLALVMGICCVIELFVHLTDGTIPNTRMPLADWPYFVTGVGFISFVVAWLTYLPPASSDGVREDQTIAETDENAD